MYKYLFAPMFAGLAWFAYHQPSPLCAVTGPYAYLTSMWFMYALMGAAHAGPWASLVWRIGRGGAQRQTSEPGSQPKPAAAE